MSQHKSEPAALCDLVAAIIANFPEPKGQRRAMTFEALRPADHPLVRAALASFPGSEIVDVRNASGKPSPEASAAL